MTHRPVCASWNRRIVIRWPSSTAIPGCAVTTRAEPAPGTVEEPEFLAQGHSADRRSGPERPIGSTAATQDLNTGCRRNEACTTDNSISTHANTRETTPRVLITGASGYIGGRLLRSLEERGGPVRCLARRPHALKARVGAGTEVVAADLLDRASLDPALSGMDIAYYLVHSMGSDGSFEQADRRAALNFGQAAKAAGVSRIIYLGGLGNADEALSAHLRSRHDVGRLLRESGVPVLEFRASIIIGAGSLSFEMIRSLVERLPLMITPRWVRVPAQPIAIDDVLEYLVAALDLPLSHSRIYEIGGADVVSYADLMRAYAHQRGMRLRMLSVPVLSPYVSSLWLGLITPLYARIGRKLIESIVHSTIVRDPAALAAFPIRPMGIEEAMRTAIRDEEREFAGTRWSDALSSSGELPTWGGVQFGSRLVDSRTIQVDTTPAAAFAPILRIGGRTGWYAWNGLWRLRGYLDLLVGGIGTRRGRRSDSSLSVGDTVDFWRVDALDSNRLRLVAEMKLPGRAWLEFEVTGEGAITTIRQTATFDPVGLPGRAYWYALFPLHQLVFGGMLRGIARAALAVDPESDGAGLADSGMQQTRDNARS